MSFISDARDIAKRDPAARNALEVFFLYSGYHAIVWHRVAHWFFKRKLIFIARALSQISRFLTGIEIHPGAQIGKGLFIDHGTGVVIGETAEVGDYCTLYHGATLGGTGKTKGKKRHPTLGKNVLVGSGAKILGPFKVGDNARVGANSVVLSEVPANATVVGVPGHIAKKSKGKDVGNAALDLDQVNLPDPLEDEIQSVVHQIDELNDKLDFYLENCPHKDTIKRKAK